MCITFARLAALCCILLSSSISPALAELRVHQSTTSPSDARFQIIQSPLAVRWTFRLDRYTGRVYQLVKTKRNGLAWQRMPVVGNPQSSKPMKPKFVLFTSGLAVRNTFLMNSDSGQTWRLTKSLDTNLWLPFEP